MIKSFYIDVMFVESRQKLQKRRVKFELSLKMGARSFLTNFHQKNHESTLLTTTPSHTGGSLATSLGDKNLESQRRSIVHVRWVVKTVFSLTTSTDKKDNGFCSIAYKIVRKYIKVKDFLIKKSPKGCWKYIVIFKYDILNKINQRLQATQKRANKTDVFH